MASREELTECLSTLPTQELLRVLKDETVWEIASQYFNASLRSSTLSSTVPVIQNTDRTKTTVWDKPKRPLNAFMAFRSYYLKLFPDVQQKTASGFLRMLWSKDPFQNKWALIARVYSFVRDEIGKNQMTPAYFFSHSCPVMRIIEPQAYLAMLGWSLQRDSHSQILVQDQAVALAQSQLQPDDIPCTEIDLLTALVNVCFLPEKGIDLIGKLAAKKTTIMVTEQARFSLPVSFFTPGKVQFMGTIPDSQATHELHGNSYDEYSIQTLGAEAHSVEDFDFMNYLPLQVELPDPRYYYSYSTPNYSSQQHQE